MLLKDTLAALFRQSTVNDQYAQSKLHVHSDMVLNDVNDGKNFKQNAILQESASLSVILYLDAFEVVNPLGSGKQEAQNYGHNLLIRHNLFCGAESRTLSILVKIQYFPALLMT